MTSSNSSNDLMSIRELEDNDLLPSEATVSSDDFELVELLVGESGAAAV